jgi:hypothetical protein
MESISGRSQLVCSRTGNSIYTTTDKVGLTNIERSNSDLHFLDSFKRNWASATRQISTLQTKRVVHVCTVNREVRHTTIATCQTHT